MSKSLIFFLVILVLEYAQGQAPQKISYQAVIRNRESQLVVNSRISIRISILKGSPTGNTVFSESHSPTSNANGLVTFEIGSGNPESGMFADIQWADGPFFIKTEVDASGGKNFSISGTQQLLSVPYALYAETAGSSKPGKDGKTILSGPRDPEADGVDGDFYFNTLTRKFFGPKNGGVWNKGVSFFGPQGEKGNDGKTILNGATDPTSEGIDGDFYLNTSTSKLFGPKTGGAWGSGVSLVGSSGSKGVDGKTILNGVSNPTSEGIDGDFYFNTSTSKLFGPKTGGAWGSGILLVGPSGSKGVDGKTILNDDSDPTNEGVDGDFYLNTSTSKLFGPKTGGTWGIGVSLVGPSGSKGVDGKTILNGVTDPTSEGVNGDFFLNTITSRLFGPKTGGAWGSGILLVGPSGSKGVDGKTILKDDSDPTNEGVDGDFYLNTSTSKLFGPKTGGTWGIGVSLVGPSGSKGVDGKTILNGVSNPTNEGVDGDFYLNTSTSKLFGPKKGGAWGSGVLLVGLPGSKGVDGKTILNGSSNPTNEGADGDFFLNTITSKLFGPKTGGAWGSGVSLVGPSGSKGVDGKTILNGVTDPTNEGVDGDFYINTVTSSIFGPRTNGIWGAGTSLIGNQTVELAGDVTGSGSGTITTTLADVNSNIGTFNNLAVNSKGLVVSASQIDYESPLTFSDGLSRNSNNVTNDLITGIAGGQVIVGGINPGENLSLSSTGDAAKGKIKFGSSAYDEANDRLGLGTISPTATLDINGNVKITDGSQGTGKVLTSDATGVATWQTPTGGGWGLTGNAGTIDGTHFIGTTDNVPFNIRVNNEKAGRIDPIKYNTFYGYQSGNATTTGLANIAIGYQSLYSNTTGGNNVAIGTYALKLNTTGIFNIGIGPSGVLINNTTGQLNTAIGAAALSQNTTGSQNTVFGHNTMTQNTIGNQNTAIGGSALDFNSSGNYNTGVGYASINSNTTGSNNAALGYVSMLSNTIGTNNSVLGAFALISNKSGSNATAIGYGALRYSNDTSSPFTNSNVAVGYEALRGSVSAAANTGNNNTAIGYQSLLNNSTGGSNVANGNSALYSNTTGTNNVGVGFRSLYFNTTGFFNVGIGAWSLKANSTGNNNVAIGNDALSENIGGNQNTAVGSGAMDFSSWGSYNTAVGAYTIGLNGNGGNYNTGIGYSAITYNYSGSNNTALGSSALHYNETGSWNTAIGVESLNYNYSGQYNTALGYQSLHSNNTGNRNIAIGYSSLYDNSFGSDNISIGTRALYSNTSGSFNASIGTNALEKNTSGQYNVAVGATACMQNTIGHQNTAIGGRALITNSTGGSNTAVGYNSLERNYAGSENTSVGGGALSNNTTGSNNTAIGFQANVGANNLTNATAIGASAIVTVSNTIQLGDGNVKQVIAGTGKNAKVIAGGLQITGGSPAVGKVLTSDATGVATWQNPFSSFSGCSASHNTFYGCDALQWNTSGTWNVAIGSQALKYNTTGDYNVALGSALVNNLSGYANTAIGYSALRTNTTGYGNTAIGTQSLHVNTTGGANVAIGLDALLFNKAGSRAVAIGYNAMYSANDQTTSFYNTNVAIGYESLFGASAPPAANTGLANTATGYQSLTNNSSGSDNTATGNSTLYANLTGGSNTAIGGEALKSNTTGNGNTGIGRLALKQNTIGNNNTAIGFEANVGANNLTNATAIGASAIVTASNNMVFGAGNVVGWGFGTSPVAGVNAIRVGTNATNGNGASLTLGGVWTNASDRNKKENFSPLNGQEILSKIAQLPVMRWNYIGEAPTVTHIGPIAQDFHQLFKVGNDSLSISTIDPAGISLLGIQELIKENNTLKELVEKLIGENKDIESRFSQLKLNYERRLQKIEALLNSEKTKESKDIAK